MDKHAPTDEFIDFLERDTLWIVRREARFATATSATQPSVRTRRFALGVGIAAGVVVSMAAGMVLGASVSYASAAVPDGPRPPLAMLPIGNAINALRCAPAATVSQSTHTAVSAKQAVSIVELSPPAAKTTQALALVLGLKEAPDGRLLVNDAGRRQVRLFEPSLATSTVVIDSAPGSSRYYGRARTPLIPFVGDSSLLADHGTENQMLVLDAHGQVSRALALVLRREVAALTGGPSGVDARGRLVYKQPNWGKGALIPRAASLLPPLAPGTQGRGATAAPMVTTQITDRPDSLAIHRVDLDTRRIDTAGFVMEPPDMRERNGGGKFVAVYGKDGAVEAVKQVINPLYMIDEWAVLSDGTIALVRGHDYHVDWVHPNGTKSSSSKLPFEWKRLTEADKQRLVDSTRKAVDSVDASAAARASAMSAFRTRCPLGSACADTMENADFRLRGRTPGDEPRAWPYEIVPLSQIADYYPPIRPGATRADRDGNLWILPRTTTLSKHGELVYDVVNPKQGLVRRVRLPLGRSVAGFGKGGVVYLQAGDLKTGFTLERTIVPGVAKPTPK
jgi:hypothetical protein